MIVETNINYLFFLHFSSVDNCTKARIGMASADLLEKAFKKEGIITPRPPPEIYTTGDPPPKRDNVIPYEEPKL